MPKLNHHDVRGAKVAEVRPKNMYVSEDLADRGGGVKRDVV